MVVAVLLVAGLVISEVLVSGLRHFWLSHPLTSSLAGFGASLALTVLVIDELRQRRDTKRWENVSHIAHRRLSGEAFKVCAGLLKITGYENADECLVDAVQHMERTGERPGVEAPALIPDEYETNLALLLEDPGVGSDLAEVVGTLAHELDDAMARWAPVMLAAPELAERLDLFSMMRNALAWVSGSAERYHRSKREAFFFWVNLRVFLLLYATFDSTRRTVLDETRSSMFGETLEEHDRAWGLPFKAQQLSPDERRELLADF